MALPKRGVGRLVVGGVWGLLGEPPEPLSSDKDGCLEGRKKKGGRQKKESKIEKEGLGRNNMRTCVNVSCRVTLFTFQSLWQWALCACGRRHPTV